MTLLQSIIGLLDQDTVSDVHLASNDSIWVRSEGDLVKTGFESPSHQLESWVSQSRYGGNPVMDKLMEKGGQDDYSCNLGKYRLRSHLFVSEGRYNLALRKLETVIPPFEKLGLPSSAQTLLTYPNGLVLVVGATGSGKSTTLASFVDQMNATIAGHIVTLEDPIEYIHTEKKCRVRQRQVGEGADCASFAAGVTAAMREDPDIILVGEVRDRLTMQACLSAAQTGHLVFATLHTNSATEAVERILSFYPESERDLAKSVLSAVLRGVLAQRLLKAVKPGRRVLAAELMLCTPAVRGNIATGQIQAIENHMETGLSEGQLTLNRCLSNLVKEGVITRDTALTASLKRKALESLLS